MRLVSSEIQAVEVAPGKWLAMSVPVPAERRFKLVRVESPKTEGHVEEERG